jgi:hypothetical protein
MLLLASLAFALAPQNLATAKIEITAAGKVSTVNNDALAVKIRTDPNFPLVPVQQDYVSPTTKIQSNDSGISALAGHVTSDSRKELEAAAAILTWVYNNVEYLPAEYSGVFSATQVLKMRRGVCGEFSVLAAAMLRSQGIPVKYVKGYIYTGSGFQSHAWLEIYVPGSGWIPADPTLGQLGLVDAGHVKIAEAADPTELSVLHENATELRLLNSTEFSGLFTVAMAATPSLSYGEQGLVQLNLTNLRDAYMLPSIRLGHSSGPCPERRGRGLLAHNACCRREGRLQLLAAGNRARHPGEGLGPCHACGGCAARGRDGNPVF